MWFSRTPLVLQYWRSMELLLAYAKDRQAEHLPAWQAFNQAADESRAVGIWHETYAVRPGGYESVYVDMPPFGLGRAGRLQPAAGGLHSAAGRLRGAEPEGTTR